MSALCLCLAVACCGRSFAEEHERGPENLAVVRANSLGVAYMNQQLPEKALHAFRDAIQADSKAVIPVVNQGLAFLYLRQLPQAKTAFHSALSLDDQSVRAWYGLGLAQQAEGNEVAAMDAFQHAEVLDPNNADIHYFLGTLFSEEKQYHEAIQQFQRTLAISPLQASAQFGLARALQRDGKTDEARVHIKRFQEITEGKIGDLISSSYGEQGRYATVEDIATRPAGAGPMIPLTLVPLPGVAATPVSQSKTSSGGGACVLEAQDGGTLELLVTAPRTGLRLFHLADNGAPQAAEASSAGLIAHGDGIACAVGDFDNDGLPDVALALTDRVLLFRNLGHGRFKDVTDSVGLTPRNKPRGLTFVDFDHDGDLDLFVTGSDSLNGANVLWRNNGNGSFTDWTRETALGGSGQTNVAVLSDINNDRAVDLVVSGGSGAPLLYENQREGAFKQIALSLEPQHSATRGIAVADFNKDGYMDLALTYAGAPGVGLLANKDGRQFERIPLDLPGVSAAWGITPIDIDNDGWIDFAVLVETAHGIELRVFRNLGPAGFRDVSDALGVRKLNLSGARSVMAVDVDHDGAADLVIGRTDGTPLILHNAGGNRNHSFRLQLTGLADNKSALGTKVEVLSGGNWQKFEVIGASGYLGQGSTEILAGLGPSDRVDVMRLLWPTGVPQDEIDLAATKPLSLTELDRRGSSCPTLFAWDGKKYAFVSDVIGAGVVGHWVSPSARNRSDPDEWVKVDGSLLQERGGSLSLRFGEPMEEINYIDQLRLVAVDHPSETQVFPDEKFLNDPPFASGALVAVSSAVHPPVAAFDDHGANVLDLLSRQDHRYVQDFALLPYAGFTREHNLTLDLGAWSPAHPLRLFLHGYVEYFSASSLFAAWQAGISPHSPSVEAQLPDGTWREVIADMGFPAGLPRTIVADLTGKLPAGARRIRIRTNLQIYWDQVLVDNGTEARGSTRSTELTLASASLGFRGYPRQIEGNTPGDLTYDYQQISSTGPFFWQRGNYTRYGDVTPLLTKVDNRFVIFGSGEDIDAEFSTSSLPPLPPGWTRDYFFYANGYVKDMDFHEALPLTVGELPFHGMSGYPYTERESFPEDPGTLQYVLDWNTRMESGDRLQRFQFNYDRQLSEPISPGQSGR